MRNLNAKPAPRPRFPVNAGIHLARLSVFAMGAGLAPWLSDGVSVFITHCLLPVHDASSAFFADELLPRMPVFERG